MKSIAIHNLNRDHFDTVLIIGYGNTLRRDDGVGYAMAEAVEEWALSGVRSRAVHQLTPELAAEMAQADLVIFVDAAAQPAIAASDELMLEPLSPETSDLAMTHSVNPRSLLWLAQRLYEATPRAYHLLIPAVDFAFGETMSELTTTYQHLALDRLRLWLSQPKGSWTEGPGADHAETGRAQVGDG